MWNFNCCFGQLSLALLNTLVWATTIKHRKFSLMVIDLELGCSTGLLVPFSIACFVLILTQLLHRACRRRSPQSGHCPSHNPAAFPS
ncbi:hypothetical protein BJV77DRAFT_1002089 [Russula vinacea]|nr:hypothetical protein BJV77DRAFT_1002089 [Russula vinacea]